jgi:hypothetical protein
VCPLFLFENRNTTSFLNILTMCIDNVQGISFILSTAIVKEILCEIEILWDTTLSLDE